MSLFHDAKLPDRALERADLSKLKPFDLMVLVLAERGVPMSYEAIQMRLVGLGREISIPTLQKAWHGRPPLRKTASSELELVPELDPFALSHAIWLVEQQLGEAPWTKRLQQTAASVDAEAPVTMDELRTAVRDPSPWSMSSGRRLGLVLEAAGQPLTTGAVLALSADLGIEMDESSLVSCGHNAKSPVRRLDDGRWTVDSRSPALLEARHFVREIIRRDEENQRHSAEWKVRHEQDRERERAAKLAEDLLWAVAPKRFVRTLSERGQFLAAALMDPDSRTFHFTTSIDEARSALASAEIVIGLDPRGELERLGLATTGRAFDDLTPSAKTRTNERTGRVLRISTDMVFRHTLGKAGKLSDLKKLLADFRRGRIGRVQQALESDLKAFYALHDYLHGHGFVRLRVGAHDEVLYGRKPVGGTPPLLALLKHACHRAQRIEVVLYEPPNWEDPWVDARRCKVERIDDEWHLLLVDGVWGSVVWFPDVYAARVLEPVR